MIRYVRGILTMVEDTEIIVENQGVGLAIWMPPSALELLPDVGEEIQVYTYFSVREDAMQLFGFLNRQDLQMFKMLITVNGIGPKAGLSILGSMTGEELRYAVATEDVSVISSAPGIGPKTAKKLILELKDKIDMQEMVEDVVTGQTEATAKVPLDDAVKDAIEALVALGYGRSEAAKAVRLVENCNEMPVDLLLKESLKNL